MKTYTEKEVNKIYMTFVKDYINKYDYDVVDFGGNHSVGNVDHPDVYKYIKLKRGDTEIKLRDYHQFYDEFERFIIMEKYKNGSLVKERTLYHFKEITDEFYEDDYGNDNTDNFVWEDITEIKYYDKPLTIESLATEMDC